MARRTQITINHAEAEKILKSEAVIEEMLSLAEEIVERTAKPTDDYEIEEWIGINRARVSIWTANRQARVNEATEHTLLQALGGMGGEERFLYTSSRGVTSLRTRAEIANYTRNRSNG
jgi:phage-related protein